MTQSVPQRVGPYLTLEPLARGGAAEIWLVVREGSGELAVLKRVLPQLADDPFVLRRMRREARITAQLLHPNIVRLLWIGEEEGRFVAVSELVGGINLDELRRTQLVAAGGPLPLGVALFVASELLAGLGYVHAARGDDGASLELVHRDLSSSNVLIGFDGAVKIADFGVARAKFDNFQTRAGVLLGTAEYMAPEQALAQTVDHRADLYAAGALIYELLTGEPVVQRGRPLMEMLEQVRSGNPPPPSSRNPTLPPALDAFMARALAKAPQARFQDASAMRQALLAAAQPHAPAPQEALAALMLERAPGALARFQAWDSVAPSLAGLSEDVTSVWESRTRAVDRSALEAGVPTVVGARASAVSAASPRTLTAESGPPPEGTQTRFFRREAQALRSENNTLKVLVGVLAVALIAVAAVMLRPRETTLIAPPPSPPLELQAINAPAPSPAAPAPVAPNPSPPARPAPPAVPAASAASRATQPPNPAAVASAPPSPSPEPEPVRPPPPRAEDAELSRAMAAVRDSPGEPARLEALAALVRQRARSLGNARSLIADIDAAERNFDADALVEVSERVQRALRAR